MGKFLNIDERKYLFKTQCICCDFPCVESGFKFEMPKLKPTVILFLAAATNVVRFRLDKILTVSGNQFAFNVMFQQHLLS